MVSATRLPAAEPGTPGAMPEARDVPTIELYQAEWCPYSSRVRQRLTELGVSFIARQVPPDSGDRDELRRRTGSDEIPALIDDGEAIPGDAEELIAYLDRRFPVPADAEEHRRQAVLHDR